MPGAVIKIRDAEEGSVDIQVEFNPAIDNSSPAHQFVARIVEMLHQGEQPTELPEGSPAESAND
jgi:hypothetical protein